MRPDSSQDYEKKKKKEPPAEYTQSSGTPSLTTGSTKTEEEPFDRKKKKDYGYETLFQKPETGSTNDTKMRQAYQASQAYRSVSTSGSRTSLDADSADVHSDLSLGGKSKTGSQLEAVKSKSETKPKKRGKKGESFESPAATKS